MSAHGKFSTINLRHSIHSTQSGYLIYHKDPSSRSLGLEREVTSRTENHCFFLCQEPAQNHKSPFLEQSIELEMNVAK